MEPVRFSKPVVLEINRIQNEILRLQGSVRSYLSGVLAGLGVDAVNNVVTIDIENGTYTVTSKNQETAYLVPEV